MKWLTVFKKKANASKPKKSKTREWVDAVVFAVIASTIIRGLLFSANAIPSGSMEGTQLVGDYMLVLRKPPPPALSSSVDPWPDRSVGS